MRDGVKIWRGWITSGFVLVPVIAGVIVGHLSDGDWMNLLPFILAAFGFCLGGLINFASLVSFLVAFRLETPSQPHAKRIFLWGQGCSALVVLGQVIACFALYSEGPMSLRC